MKNKVKPTKGITVDVLTADREAMLEQLYHFGCKIYNVSFPEPLTIRFQITFQDFQYVQPIFQRKGIEYAINDAGRNNSMIQLLRRPVLLAGVALLFVLTIFLPRRIYFIEIIGNETIPSRCIQDVLTHSGIQFGCRREAIRSEEIKNHLLESIPELQWVGVNTCGCVATVTVREKTQNKEKVEEQYPVSSIVASRDGRIISCTVLEGSAQCVPGQTVVKGQMLVSGYTDCEIYLKATNAKADILAQTVHDLTVISPSQLLQRRAETDKQTIYFIRIGKKLIKLKKDSGISDMTCVKIQKEKNLILPGGLSLPVSFIREEHIFFDVRRIVYDDISWIHEFTDFYLREHMVAGQILDRDVAVEVNSDQIVLTGNYDCTEMIGHSKQEEIITIYGNDGTHS